MAGLRFLAFAVIAGLVAIGVVSDQQDRPMPTWSADYQLETVNAELTTWFCAGGEVAGELLRTTLALINVSDEPGEASITTLGSDQRTFVKLVPGRTEVSVTMEELTATADWAGALIETSSPDLFVEQRYTEGSSGRSAGFDQLPCATSAGTRHLIGVGATRTVAEGERMVLMMANPFHADAVVDLHFDTDVGFDTRSAVVVPGRSVVTIPVEEEVPVAGRVHVVAENLSGRLVVQRLQIRNGESIGMSVVPAVQGGAVVSVLPSVMVDEGISDQIAVTNPSPDEVAEVDLEVLTTSGQAPDPIELTVRPGRTVIVDLASEARLSGLGAFAVRARSLTGIPVAVSLERTGSTNDAAVGGLAGMAAIDGSATRWLTAQRKDQTVLSVVNPSATESVTVELLALSTATNSLAESVTIGPEMVSQIDVSGFPADAMIDLSSSGPVVVAREDLGTGFRQMLAAVARSGLIPLNSSLR